ncbi:diguanylate cyclase/phosphodiesterase with PAS/PAC sensor(s) [Aquipluma nitroreducens]|uniref:histidine kinase n=1 Tax=Aquipluma nitroreducens TaxID=2010828 RepID=A0A5K7SE38_9BACT|nr:response regulator [Aquipluma nitroreducens]BBE19726.1 diguanylate cyclase/phosphodiesterase with PAS/PAC sensor(s) [Aquipluma nitroreducens]
MKRVLIVDDIKENLYLLESLLKGYGYATVTANNGAEALGLGLKEPPDLIIADILMPVMDGYTLCREWKKDDTLKNIPFIFYTATYTHPKDGEFALSLGADRFIIKPQEPEDFMNIIEQVLSEFRNGKIQGSLIPESSEVSMLKEYNETLIRKMEDRMIKSEEAEMKIRIYASQLEQEIEQRKQAELELIEALKRAEESDGLKSAFLANMSHEIRTPMNGILGFAELLKEPDLTGEQQQEYIKIIEKSGARMLNIINDIVDISKIESGQMKATLLETNINEQLEFIYKLFNREVEQKGLQLLLKKVSLPPESIVETDREKLYAILTNLVKNSIKYTSKGFIEFGCDIAENGHGLFLQYFVKDTGIGIPQNRHDAIFERFIQVDVVDKMARQGAGLGLAISKAYVEMLGGKIWIESEEGKGSTFWFTIPYLPVSKNGFNIGQEVLTPIEENQIKKLKIIIAEDDKSSSQLISIIIRKIAGEIIIVENGTEAVRACFENPDTDLILMDIQMPIMDGYEATRQIRQFNTDVIIIAQTAFALCGDNEKAIEAGCNDYVSKPIKTSNLLNLISKHAKQ